MRSEETPSVSGLVYLVTRDVHYEGSEPLAIFTDKDKAEDFAAVNREGETWRGVDWTVWPMVLNTDTVHVPTVFESRV